MSQHNVQLIEHAYAAFSRGDIPAVLEMFAERLEYFGVVSDASWKAPWYVPARTRAEVGGYFEKLIGALEPVKFEFQHLAGGGDFVYATTQQQWRVRKSGRLLELRDSFHRFEIVKGRIVGWIASEDTQRTRETLEAS